MGCDRLRRKRNDIGEAPPTLRCAIAPPYSPRGILRELLRDPNILPLPGEGELLRRSGLREDERRGDLRRDFSSRDGSSAAEAAPAVVDIGSRYYEAVAERGQLRTINLARRRWNGSISLEVCFQAGTGQNQACTTGAHPGLACARVDPASSRPNRSCLTPRIGRKMSNPLLAASRTAYSGVFSY